VTLTPITAETDSSNLPQKSKSRHGWLRCSVCTKKLSCPARLVNHVIREHGGCRMQCAHCFFRASGQLGMLLHTLASHPSAAQESIL
jgi:hypothetical protein